MNIFITGATGNVGVEVVKALSNSEHTIIAGVRNVDQTNIEGVELRTFDFVDPSTFENALVNCDVLFLLRPPNITVTNKIFLPLLESAKHAGISRIIFISVQGAEQSKLIPHHKMEALIKASGIAYTFLRPAYFMQNFTTTLRSDMQKNRIFLPAGNAKFTLIDIRDIAFVTKVVIENLDQYKNSAYDLTSYDLLSFEEMTAIINSNITRTIEYVSPNPVSFYVQKRQEGFETGYIMVLLLLHMLPRFQKPPQVNSNFPLMFGAPPISFAQFCEDYKNQL
jgi:uncharacterized protein YbjT (DUF2867 family)